MPQLPIASTAGGGGLKCWSWGWGTEGKPKRAAVNLQDNVDLHGWPQGTGASFANEELQVVSSRSIQDILIAEQVVGDFDL